MRKADGRLVTYFENRNETLFPSGVKRVDTEDEFVLFFENGDIRHQCQTHCVYYFKEGDVTQSEYPECTVYVFGRNMQVEKHYKNGQKKIYFRDG